MESRLNLNMELVEKARASASKVADDVQEFIDAHTTVTVERAVCRLLGIDGVNDVDVPLPNVVVDHLHEKGILPGGAAFYDGVVETPPITEQMRWYDAIENDTDPVVLPEQACIISEILEAIYISAKTGEPFYFQK